MFAVVVVSSGMTLSVPPVLAWTMFVGKTCNRIAARMMGQKKHLLVCACIILWLRGETSRFCMIRVFVVFRVADVFVGVYGDLAGQDNVAVR